MPSIAIVICTHNRAALLADTLQALGRAEMPPCPVELIVVDNNSTDGTREVVEAAVLAFPVRYLFEGRQGKSFALNQALGTTSADVLALTDDDVRPDEQWLSRIAGAFTERDDLVFLFGKVLPRWETPPPPEMLDHRAQAIWGPLALIDYGDAPTPYPDEAPHRQRLPIGANLAFRRQAIATIGGWRTDLGKVDNSLISGEDHEIFIRLRGAGLYRGLYDPQLVVRHFVPAQRLTRRYFRRWFYWHGQTNARMADAIFDGVTLAETPHIAGVPRFIYRQAFEQAVRCCRTFLARDRVQRQIESLRLVEFAGFLAHGWRQAAQGRRLPRLGREVKP